MKTPGKIIGLLVLILAAAAIGFAIGHHGAATKVEDAGASTTQTVEEEKVATVQVVPLRRAVMSEIVPAYGSVIAEPDEVAVVSVPFETRVGRILVTAGQPVEAGTPLMGVGPSPETEVQLQEARNALTAAQRDLGTIQQKFKDRLATTTDLSAAEQTAQSAELKLSSLEKRGAGGSQQLKAESAGVINKVDVQEGQIVPGGGPLVEIAVENQIEVKLGVEPDDAAHIRSGQAVSLAPVHRATSTPIEGTVRLVTRRVNPETRLVDVYVKLPKDSGVVLEEFVRGELVTASKDALVVPRSAVQPQDSGWSLFTIEKEHAVKHTVSLGLQNDKQVEVTGEGIKEGDSVVTVGNYVLENGMEVRVQGAESAASATAPADVTAPVSAPTTAPSTTQSAAEGAGK